MKIPNSDRVQVLVRALPYIQTHKGKTVVVKYGGNAMVNEDLKAAVISDIVLMQLVGIHVVLVHGGGPEISAMLKKIGKESRFVNGMRYTDEETVDIVQMVLAGKINRDLVQLLERNNGRAVDLCGLDGGMTKVQKLQAEENLGFVGDITHVNTSVITNVTEAGYVLVIATVGADENGTAYNINADVAVSRIAAALGAERLILMTDIRGLLRDKNDEEALIPQMNVSDMPRLKKEGIISGGTIPKIDCYVGAVWHGVPRAHIIDGRTSHSILIELFSDEEIGTMFY